MSKTTEKICEALAGLKSAITRAEIVERTGLSSPDVGGSLHALVVSGVVLKHAGATKRTTGYTLNPDHAPDQVRAKKTPRTPAPRSIKEIAQRVASRPDGNGLAQRHVLTTLGMLATLIETNIDDQEVLAAFTCHQEAVQIASSCAI